MGKSICLLPDSKATKQTSRRFAVWQTTAISLPRVTCAGEPFQCVNRQIAGALHFKLMHSTVSPPWLLRVTRRVASGYRIAYTMFGTVQFAKEVPTSKRSVCLRRFYIQTVRSWPRARIPSCLYVSMCGVRASTPNEARRSIKRIARSYFIFDRLMCKISNKTRGMFV